MESFHKTLENSRGDAQRGHTDVSCHLVYDFIILQHSLTLIPSHILDLDNYQRAFWRIRA